MCEEDLDHVTGFAHAEDLLADCLRRGTIDRGAVRSAVRSPLFVPSSMPVIHLLDAFHSSRQHAAVVLDEYGGVDGLVTLHDALEAIVGDLPSVDDEEESPAFTRRPDGAWLVDASLPVVDVEARLDVALHEADGQTGYQTLAGFALARLGRLPKAGDRFSWREYRFEVVAMDGRRVDRVLVVPVREEGGRAGAGETG